MIDLDEIAAWTAANAYARASYLGTMPADDPRHGTIAGHTQHARVGSPICDACREAKSAYVRDWRARYSHGDRTPLPILGTQRRIQALMRLGWPLPLIADRAGVSKSTASRITHGGTPRVLVRVAEDIAAVYDDLWMRPGPNPAVARRAARLGWAAPLAWDDIDHDEAPQGVRRAA